MKRFIHILLFMHIPVMGWVQKDEFIIRSKDNKELGYLKVERSHQDGVTIVEVNSKITVKKVITIVISYELNSQFKSGKLISSYIVTYRNDNPHEYMSTLRENGTYLFTKNTKQHKVRDFDYSESMMYYQEPVGINYIYSEFDGVFKPTEYEKKEGCYALTNPLNKNVSRYYYKDGKLDKAIVKHALITLYLYKKK